MNTRMDVGIMPTVRMMGKRVECRHVATTWCLRQPSALTPETLKHLLTFYPSLWAEAGKYPMPNDEEEQARMDYQHHLYLILFSGGLYRAPLPQKITRALDIGTGTGKWAFGKCRRLTECWIL